MKSFNGLYCFEEVNSSFINCNYSIDKSTMKDSDYKYLINPLGISGCPRAFRTDSGFKNFLKVFNLSIVKSSIEVFGSKGERFVHCRLKGKYRVCSFWHKNDVPRNAKSFIGLSNGSYVDCYYADIDGWRIIYKPNPNAKEVYKPYKNYIEISKKMG